MTYWIYPWKEKYYDLFGCLHEFGYVEWRQRNKVSVGDRVLLYAGAPIFRLIILFEITEIDIPFSKNITWSYSSTHSSSRLTPTDLYSKLVPIAFLNDTNPVFSREYLLNLGMPERVQQPIKANTQIINLIIEDIESVEQNYDIKNSEFEEGVINHRLHRFYERNQAARRECLSLMGHSCRICGLNFEERYGEIGKGYIEVHHLEFLSSSNGVSRTTKPANDLIPVCSNCHSMLHRKYKGVYLSPDQLKQMLHKA